MAAKLLQQRFETIQNAIHSDEFHSTRIVDMTVLREPEAPPERISGTEQPDTGNTKEIRCVKHAGVDAEEQVGLMNDFKRVNQRKALRVGHAAAKSFEVQLRLFEIHKEGDKAGMARKESGEKIL